MRITALCRRHGCRGGPGRRSAPACGTATAGKLGRAFAGQFYPADPRRCVRRSTASPRRGAAAASTGRALVVPHAGYVYSGQIAADAFRQAAATPVDTVVILGANHTNGTFRRVSVYDGEATAPRSAWPAWTATSRRRS